MKVLSEDQEKLNEESVLKKEEILKELKEKNNFIKQEVINSLISFNISLNLMNQKLKK